MPHTSPTVTTKQPSEWATGDEPMTSRQSWFLKSLCEKAEVEFPQGLSKAEASKRIDELQAQVRAAKVS